MQINFLYNEMPVEADRFVAKIKAHPDPDHDIAELHRNAVRVAVQERYRLSGKTPPNDLPVVYAPEKT